MIDSKCGKSDEYVVFDDMKFVALARLLCAFNYQKYNFLKQSKLLYQALGAATMLYNIVGLANDNFVHIEMIILNDNFVQSLLQVQIQVIEEV